MKVAKVELTEEVSPREIPNGQYSGIWSSRYVTIDSLPQFRLTIDGPALRDAGRPVTVIVDNGDIEVLP